MWFRLQAAGRMKDAYRSLLRRVWADLENDRIEPTPQDESRATVWPGRTPEDGEITPEMSVNQAGRLVRATTRPYPGAFVDHPEHGRVRIWAGQPDRGEPSAADELRLSLCDGVYRAVDYEIEGGHV